MTIRTREDKGGKRPRSQLTRLAYDLFLALVPPFLLAILLHFGLGIG